MHVERQVYVKVETHFFSLSYELQQASDPDVFVSATNAQAGQCVILQKLFCGLKT